MDSKTIENFLWGLGALAFLNLIAAYLAIFGRVDRSDEHGAIAHRVSKKH